MDMDEKNIVDEISGHFSLKNIEAIIITGSNAQKSAYKKSDFDIRIIVEDYRITLGEARKLILANKLVSWKEDEEFSEIKFFYDNQSIHLLFYSSTHVDKCLTQKRRSFISTVVNGTLYYSVNKFEEIRSKCEDIFEELRNSEEYLISAKSFFVKAMARYESNNYLEFLFCLRIASTNLAKHYLNQNGCIFIKEQSLLSEFSRIAAANNKLHIFEVYKTIQGLNDLNTDSMKNYIRRFNDILLGVSRDE